MPQAIDLETLLRAPWSIRGPVLEQCEGEEYFTIRIDEFPGFLVTGTSPAEAIREFNPVLRAWLQVMLDDADPIPAPRSKGFMKPVPGWRHSPASAQAPRADVNASPSLEAILV